MALRRCIEPDCHQLTDATRCPTHRAQRNKARAQARTHYHGNYRQRANQLKREAQAVDAPCWLCHQPINYLETGRPDSFNADHTDPGNPHSPLLPAHAHCNSSRGGQTRRQQAGG